MLMLIKGDGYNSSYEIRGVDTNSFDFMEELQVSWAMEKAYQRKKNELIKAHRQS